MTSRVLSKIASTPWAMDQDALAVVVDIATRAPVDETALDSWKARLAPTREALGTRQETQLSGSARARVRDGVAIVPVSGPIFRYANMMTDYSGATSLATFAGDMQLAADASGIRAIMIEVDSPGGEVTGMAEAASLIRSISARKPVIAYTEGQMASAAYLIGAAAREIVVAPTAILGSLGVVMTMMDRRDADARAGIRRYEFVSSQTPGKRPAPDSDAGRAQLQSLADRLADEYLADVAHSRGMTVEALIDATGGGGTIIGRDAVRSGLADRIGGYEETLARLAAGDVPADRKRLPPSASSPLEPKDITMTNPTTPATEPVATPTPEAVVQPTTPVAPPPAPVALAPAPVDPVAAERARAAAINGQMKPGFHALATLAISEGWTPETFASAQDASASAVAAAQHTNARVGFQGSFPAPVAAGTDPDPANLPPEQRWTAAWDADPKLRSQFLSKEDYLAFQKAEASGRARIKAA